MQDPKPLNTVATDGLKFNDAETSTGAIMTTQKIFLTGFPGDHDL